jgi:hypothetical protein
MQPSWIIQVAVKIRGALNIQVSSEPAPIAMFPKANGNLTISGLFEDLQRTLAI